jgi:hypothetical protein
MAEKINWQAQLPPGREMLILDPVLKQLQPTLDAMVNEQGLAPRQVVEGLTQRQFPPKFDVFPCWNSAMAGTLVGAAKTVLTDSKYIENSGGIVIKYGPAQVALLESTDDLGKMDPEGQFGNVLKAWGWNTNHPEVIRDHQQFARDLRSVVPEALRIIRER